MLRQMRREQKNKDMLAHGALLGWPFSTIQSMATETTFSQNCKRGTKRNNVREGGRSIWVPLPKTFRIVDELLKILISANNFIQTTYWLQTIFAIEATRKPFKPMQTISIESH